MSSKRMSSAAARLLAEEHERSPSGAPLTEQAARRPFSRRTINMLREASSLNGAKAWLALTDKQRRSLLAYLLDDAAEYPKHRPANIAAAALLFAIEDAEGKKRRRDRR